MISSILTSEGRMILETVQHEETGDFHGIVMVIPFYFSWYQITVPLNVSGPPYSIEEQLISDLFCSGFAFSIVMITDF
jgi:hypothetical protein